MHERIFSIDPELEKNLAKALKDKFAIDIFAGNFSNSTEVRRIAKCVLQLSDYYISGKSKQAPNPTPWQESWCQLAYLGYYMLLNEVRCRSVLQEAERTPFLQGIEQVTDFGSGLGAATFELSRKLSPSTKYVHIEKSAVAQALHKQIIFSQEQSRWTDLPGVPAKHNLGVFSFSLNEMEYWPEWIQQFDKLMIIEPATSQQGRVLLENRKKLIEKGFHIWSPCTHQGACPLLEKSKNDWCHDRVHFKQPDWFAAIEHHLPIKNQTLTYSYLLAAKTPPPEREGIARITGDYLEEKGKSRQLVCRGPEREYFTWMHKNLAKGEEPQVIPRGALIRWPKVFEEKSNEIRLSGPVTVMEMNKFSAV